MPKYTEQEQEVINVHNVFWEALANRDIDLRFSCCSENVTFIGTGLHEKAANKAEYRIMNEKGVNQFPEPFQIEFIWTNISMFHKQAVVTCEVIWKQSINGEVSSELVRSTTLLNYEEDVWKIVHVHGSVPDYRLAEGEYMKTEKIMLRNRELEQQVYERTQELEHSLAELKSTQAQLIQSEKMASLGELTAGIAHEIQNPLNFVNNFAEVNVELIAELKEELEAGNLEEIKSIADDIAINEEKILQHGKRADSIVKGMLQHSRSSNGQKELTDINTLCDEYLRLSYHGLRAKDKSFNADFKTEFDASLPKINIIPQDIGRVLLNLINNAFYVVAERQKNLSGIEETYKPSVTITTKNLGESIEISVKDNGNGIPEEIKNKIFQPFFTTKPTGEGTGLGLSLSYDIVKAHGGVIKAESLSGEGTTFVITLPNLNIR
jgi:signal transduction histidine kinase